VGCAVALLCLRVNLAQPKDPKKGEKRPPPPGQNASPKQSSPVVISSDDSRLIVVNPAVNTITAFDVTTDSPALIAEVKVGRDPRSLAVTPDISKLYVANAHDGTVTVLSLPDYSTLSTIQVGVEPMAVVLSPQGTRLYVANSASNSLSVIDTSMDKVIATVDLSGSGTAPRAIAVTSYGPADSNETIFVASFYGQLRPGKSFLQEGQDDQREGHIVAISAATNQPISDGNPNPVVLGPLANTGFNSNGQLAPATFDPMTNTITPAVASTNPQTFTTPTGCYPNQLASIAIQPYSTTAYVVSTAPSPNGPFRFNVNAQGLLSVFAIDNRTEVIAPQTDQFVRQQAPLNLNQGLDLLNPLPNPQVFHTNPVAIAWRPDGSDAWVAIQHSDLIVRVTPDANTNTVPTVGAPLASGPGAVVRVDLQLDAPQGMIPGKAPQGIAIKSDGTRAYASNFISRSVTVIDISYGPQPVIVGTAQASALPSPGSPAAVVQLGAELFYSGRGPNGRMSMNGWGACIVCHPNGRSDSVTWIFPAGPRQTISLDGMFNRKNPADQRILNWSALRDENQDFELNTRNVFGGRGLIDDDRLFLAISGGTFNPESETPLIEQFQQVTGAVTTTNDLANGAALPDLSSFSPRRDFAVATLGDDRVFIIGGRAGINQGTLIPAADAVLEFNPRTNVLRRRSSTGFTLRHSLGAAAVRTSQGSRIYAIGGYNSTNGAATPVATVEEYNPFTDAWRTVASLPTGVAQFAITTSGGLNTAEPLQLIHVISGNVNSENIPALTKTGFNPIQRFQADPAGPGTWSTFNPPGLTLRRLHGAATVIRGVQSRVFIVGGLNAAGTTLDTVEEYLAQAVTLAAGAHTSLPAPRAQFGVASSLTTNQIYVVGGRDQNNNDQSTIFELTVANNGPVAGPPGQPSGTWANRGNLSSIRRWVQLSNPPGITNLLPFRSSGRDARQDAIAQWIAKKVRASRAPVDRFDPAAIRGRELFGQVGLVLPGMSCASCHAGAKWTRSSIDAPPPDPANVIGAELRHTSSLANVLFNVGTFNQAGRQNEVRFNAADISQAIAPLGANGFNVPSLLSVHETAPYFYSGLAQTLDEVLNGSRDGNGGMRVHFVQDPKRRADLIQFLRSIDNTTPPFPVPPGAASSAAKAGKKPGR
jgi:YVTN family beta-propeller protein